MFIEFKQLKRWKCIYERYTGNGMQEWEVTVKEFMDETGN